MPLSLCACVDYFDNDVPQCGQLRQSLCTPRPQDGQVSPGAAEITFRTSQTTPTTTSARKPTGTSHMNIMPIQPKGLKPHPPNIIPGPIIPQPPYLQPPSRLAATWKTTSAIMVMTATAIQLTLFIFPPVHCLYEGTLLLDQAGNGCPSACPRGDPQYAQVFQVACTICPQAEHLLSCNFIPQLGQKVKPDWRG